MKKWLVTFTVENPTCTGYAIVFAANANEASTIVKSLSRFRNATYLILSIEEFEYSRCDNRFIIAEGITLEGTYFIPHISNDGVLTWTNAAGHPNPAPYTIKGEKGDLGESITHIWEGTILKLTDKNGTTSTDLKGEKGDRGLVGPKGDKGDTGNSGCEVIDENETLSEDANFGLIFPSTPGNLVLLMTLSDLNNYHSKESLQFNYDEDTETLDIITTD